MDGKVILASADAKAEHINLELLSLSAHVAIRRIPLQYGQCRVVDPDPDVLIGSGSGFYNEVGSGSGFCNEVGSGSGFKNMVGSGSGLHIKV